MTWHSGNEPTLQAPTGSESNMAENCCTRRMHMLSIKNNATLFTVGRHARAPIDNISTGIGLLTTPF